MKYYNELAVVLLLLTGSSAQSSLFAATLQDRAASSSEKTMQSDRNGVVSGRIIDAKTKEPLIGVNVRVKNTPAIGTVTDSNGRFVLSIKNPNSILSIHSIGYSNKEVSVSSLKMSGTIEMETDNFNLNEVVVTGQGGAIQKRRLSSNVFTVNSKEMAKLPQARLDQMLQDALPNVQVNMSNGQPGATSIIKSRGLSSAFSNSTPVIYVDGVRVDNMNTGAQLNNTLSGNSAASGSISDIPMENIDHIEYVSGGAATTLYGSDAANGVIQIFTKKGGKGSFNASIQSQLGADVASSQFYHFKRTKDLLHQTGFSQKYSLSFSGGKDNYGYSFGASMSNSTGTLIHNNNEDRKYDMRFGSRVQLTKTLEFQNSFGVVVQDFNRSRNGNQGGYTGLWFTEGSADTNFTYLDQNGKRVSWEPDIDLLDDYAYEQMKVFVNKAEALQYNRESVRRFQTSNTLIYKPLKNVILKGIIGLDYRLDTNKNIQTNEYLIFTQQKNPGTSDAGSINNFDRNYLGVTAEINGQYTFNYKDWLSSITTAGFQYFNTYDHQSVYSGLNVRDGAQIMTGAGTQKADEWLSYLYNYGAFVQENIGFWNRYFIDLGLRADYNTAFGDNVGWQYYPKIGLSYELSEERFMQSLVNSGWVNMIKLFGNYGIAGTYPPAFEYQKTIGVSSFLSQQAATFGKYGNPDLGPEKKYSYEVGFNTVLFHNFLNIGFTYYYALTRGALFSVPTLPSSGQSSTYLANIGKIENKGVEIVLGLHLVNTKDWQVMVKSSFNTNHNKVLSTGGQVPFAVGGFSSRTVQTVVEEGKPVGFIRGAKAILNADGSLKEVKLLQDLGSTIPTFYGNLALNVSYKHLSFYANGDYQAGSYVHSFDRQFRFAKGLKDPAVPDKALENTTQGKVWLDFTNFFVEKANYFKVRNIGVNYTFKLNTFIKTIDLGFNVYNPFSFTSSSVDPDAVLSGARSQGAVATGGLNYSTYSTPRQYIGTIKVSF